MVAPLQFTAHNLQQNHSSIIFVGEQTGTPENHKVSKPGTNLFISYNNLTTPPPHQNHVRSITLLKLGAYNEQVM